MRTYSSMVNSSSVIRNPNSQTCGNHELLIIVSYLTGWDQKGVDLKSSVLKLLF